ncbi:hypothetical protein P7C73_g4013, partial [Tremellales sp. Uapishka_1]
MSGAFSHPAPAASAGSAPPAAPPSKMEIERKLSFKSAARPSVDSPKKPRKPSGGPPLSVSMLSGNESDTSSVTSTVPQPQLSPLLSPTGGLTAIVERHMRIGEESEEEFEDEVEGEGTDEDDLEMVEGREGELERDMEGERVVKSGYLYKKQERRKAWKKRWFVLRTVKVAYYKDDKEYSLCRLIDLQTVHTVAPVTVKKHPFSFGIVTNKRTFFARAASQDEMEEWVRAFNGVRRKLAESQENPRGGMAIPSRAPAPAERPEIDTHPGTFSSVFSQTASTSGSPTSNPNYFGSFRHPSLPIGARQAPPLPIQITNPPVTQPLSQSQRREPSASSISSAGLPLPPVINQSSDEDEAYFSDPAAAFESLAISHPAPPTPHHPTLVDPNKVILSAYLMKRSKGRGRRKVWRKRWFYLTSQGLTYTKSHMDSRALRFIPLSSVLDALEFATPTQSSLSQSDDPSPSAPRPTAEENIFRIITPKRTYVLCAPTEEDEIKWLAAFRALLDRERGETPLGPIQSQPQQPAPVETSAGIGSGAGAWSGTVTSSAAGQGSGLARGRSATQSAKSAVADVVKRFHHEGSERTGLR